MYTKAPDAMLLPDAVVIHKDVHARTRDPAVILRRTVEAHIADTLL